MGRSATSQPVTIADVAAQAKVSRATVSRVMNGRATVDHAIAERVRHAAAALSYSPSAVARSLATGTTQTIGLIVPDLSNPMFHTILRDLSAAAAPHGYRILVAESAENLDEEPLLAREARKRCDAVVLCAPRLPDETLIRLLPQLDPVVVINHELDEAHSPTINMDFEAGMHGLTEHLLDLGHRRLAYLAGPPESVSNAHRERALAALQKERDFEVELLRCGAMFADGHDAADAVTGSSATAVIAYNDMVAFGLLSALHERQISVPGDISVVGFDDIPFARYTTPPLTTVSHEDFSVGTRAWESLWAVMHGEKRESDVRLTPKLVVRGSSGPAPG